MLSAAFYLTGNQSEFSLVTFEEIFKSKTRSVYHEASINNKASNARTVNNVRVKGFFLYKALNFKHEIL